MTERPDGLSAAQAAARVGVTTRAIYSWVATGRLEPIWRAPQNSGPRPQYVFAPEDVDAAARALSPSAQELGRRRRYHDEQLAADPPNYAATAEGIVGVWRKLSGETDPAKVLYWVASELAVKFRQQHPRLARRWVYGNYRPESE